MLFVTCLVRSGDVLDGGDTAKGIRMFFFGITLKEYRWMAGVCHRVFDAVTLGNQVRVRRCRVERQ
ncbi:hypothetical protein D3C75_1301240 [compost metagenome]